jgi:hypothetical protein
MGARRLENTRVPCKTTGSDSGGLKVTDARPRSNRVADQWWLRSCFLGGAIADGQGTLTGGKAARRTQTLYKREAGFALIRTPHERKPLF